MAPLEKEVMENILGNVLLDDKLSDSLSELNAFLALSAVSKAWRSAAEASQLWQRWLFQSALIGPCTSFDLAAWFAKRQDDITTHHLPTVYPSGRSGRPILIIPAPLISAMPLFVKAHTSWAKEVSIVIISEQHSYSGSLASLAHYGFHQLYFPDLEHANIIYNIAADPQNYPRERHDFDSQDVSGILMCGASLSPLKTAKAVDIECLPEKVHWCQKWIGQWIEQG